MYQVPETMADAVEQFRIDELRSAMEKLNVGPEIFELLVTEDDSVTDDFGTLCDPIGYFARFIIEATSNRRRLFPFLQSPPRLPIWV